MTSNTAQASSVSSAQVIQFPRQFQSNEIDPIDVIANVLEMKVAAAEEALAFIMDNTFRDIANAGFSLADDRQNGLLVAQVRAIMYDHLGLQHPFHVFVEQHCEQVDELLANQLDLICPDDLLDEE